MAIDYDALNKAMAGAEDSPTNTLTVEYHALNGMVFTQADVKWYEMSEAFAELSRRAYKHDTSVHFVVVY